MLGFLVFGTLTAALLAELYFLNKIELAKEKKEHKCNCGCHEEDEVDIVDSLGCKCGHGCCGCKEEEKEEE